jgi:CDGSH-type Zn-finger protein
VEGNVALDKEEIACDAHGTPIEFKKIKQYPAQEKYALCRCGSSKNKPFCDGSHAKAGFDGTETAPNVRYDDQAAVIEGPSLVLKDAQDYCFGAGFCHRAGSAWTLTEKSGDKTSREIAIDEACKCPSGRLVACDKKTGKAIEPALEKSISLLEEPRKGVSGPIFLKGGIALESEKCKYEARNRMCVCRCGKSENKPFCDGSHVESGFRDDR